MKLNSYIKISLLILAGSLFSCSNSKTTIQQELLIGSWIDQSPSALHFSILKDGIAQSDNMSTLLYRKWKVDGENITFTIESIGNGTSSIADETYRIKKLSQDSLLLIRNQYEFKYSRK